MGYDKIRGEGWRGDLRIREFNRGDVVANGRRRREGRVQIGVWGRHVFQGDSSR